MLELVFGEGNYVVAERGGFGNLLNISLLKRKTKLQQRVVGMRQECHAVCAYL